MSREHDHEMNNSSSEMGEERNIPHSKKTAKPWNSRFSENENLKIGNTQEQHAISR